jgi:hypothetical protein
MEIKSLNEELTSEPGWLAAEAITRGSSQGKECY